MMNEKCKIIMCNDAVVHVILGDAESAMTKMILLRAESKKWFTHLTFVHSYDEKFNWHIVDCDVTDCTDDNQPQPTKMEMK